MPWQTILLIRFAAANLAAPILLKKIADNTSKSWLQFWMFFYCALFSIMFFIATQNFSVSSKSFYIFLLGGINSLAVYCSFRAINVSLSKTYGLFPLANIIAVFFGLVFLKESRFLNINIIIGASFCFISAGLLMFCGKNNVKKTGKHFIKWIIGISIIGGFVSFCIRRLALSGIAAGEFLLFWYLGSLAGSALLLIPAKKNECFNKINTQNNIYLLILSLISWLALFLYFAAAKIVPLVIIEPIVLASSILAPILLGLFLFKEVKNISIIEIIALAAGVLGGFIIAINF